MKDFHPIGNFKALLDQIYDAKFDKRVTLVVVLLSMIYTVYRTEHYLAATFGLPAFVSWPTSGFVEALVLAAGAFVFVALRNAYIAQLKRTTDEGIALVFVWISYLALSVAFVALLFVALSDAWRLTQDAIPTLIMSLSQITQMLFIVGFIGAATLDDRERLRKEIADLLADEEKARKQQAQLDLEQQREEIRKHANDCPYCGKPQRPNNYKRHVASCSMRGV